MCARTTSSDKKLEFSIICAEIIITFGTTTITVLGSIVMVGVGVNVTSNGVLTRGVVVWYVDLILRLGGHGMNDNIDELFEEDSGTQCRECGAEDYELRYACKACDRLVCAKCRPIHSRRHGSK